MVHDGSILSSRVSARREGDLLLHALPIAEHTSIANPGQVLHDELRSLCLSSTTLSAHLYKVSTR